MAFAPSRAKPLHAPRSPAAIAYCDGHDGLFAECANDADETRFSMRRPRLFLICQPQAAIHIIFDDYFISFMRLHLPSHATMIAARCAAPPRGAISVWHDEVML